MYGYRCVKCNLWWACQSAPGQEARAITRWCPNCLPTVLPRVDMGSVRTAL